MRFPEAQIGNIILSVLLVLASTTDAIAQDTTTTLGNRAAGHDVSVKVNVLRARGVALEGVVVALTSTSGESVEATQTEIVQTHAQFKPFISIVQAGANVSFPNKDPFAHHVYSFSEAKTFELPLHRGEDVQKIRVSEPGIVSFGCNIHDWMLGYMAVVDTPHFTFLDRQGVAEFQNLPLGQYQVAVWHPSMTDFWKTEATVTAVQRVIEVSLPNKLRSVRPLNTPDAGNSSQDY